MSLTNRLIGQFVSAELERPLEPSTHRYTVIDALRDGVDDDASRAICVTYAEESVTAELDNLIDVLQDDDMRPLERQMVAIDLVARTVVLADAIGVDPTLLASTVDRSLHESVAELKKIADFGPTREAAGLYNVEEDKPIFNSDEKKPWNVQSDDKVDELIKQSRETVEKLKEL